MILKEEIRKQDLKVESSQILSKEAPILEAFKRTFIQFIQNLPYRFYYLVINRLSP